MDWFLRMCSLFLFMMPCAVGTTQASPGPERVIAGGMVAIERWFPDNPDTPDGGYTQLEIPLRIDKSRGTTAIPIGRRSSGSMAVTAATPACRPIPKMKSGSISSIWGAIRWDLVGLGVNCGFFTHEGKGVQCWVLYPWKPGVTYVFLLKRLSPANFQLSVLDESNGVTTRMAVIQTPQAWGRLKPRTVSFLEDFAQGSDEHSSCAEVPSSSAVFFRVLANGDVPPRSTGSYTYGNCKEIARTSCTTEEDCTASANMPE